MADNYAQLKRRLQLLIDRDDASDQIGADGVTEDVLDLFIANAERRFYRSEAARTPPFEKIVNYELTTGPGVSELALPADYYETRYLTIHNTTSGIQRTLTRVSPEVILNTNINASTYLPSEFAYGDVKWILRKPSEQASVTALYYGFLDALATQTDTVNTHWLLNNADDLIMYWAAVEASLYYGSVGEMEQVWSNRAQIIHDQIVEQEIRQQSSGSTPRMRRYQRQPASRSLF